MTKKLEELFNLDEKAQPIPELELPVDIPVKDHAPVRSIDDSYAEVERITQSLPAIKELDDMGESELDDLAKKAEDAYDNRMD